MRRAERLEQCAYTAVSVALSLAVTALFSYAFHHEVRSDFMITGGACSAAVSWFVAGYGARLKRQLEQARQQAHDLRVREEKLETLRQVMRKVQHHVNNLATNLQIVEIEYRRDGTLSLDTLKALHQAVHDVGQQMNRLGRIDDPFDPAPFEVGRPAVKAPPAGDAAVRAISRREPPEAA